MVQRIKTDLCSLVRELGYKITDNGAYVEDFPWLMARLGAYQCVDSLDSRVEVIKIVIDIFSKYKGEKEILDIASNITNHIQTLKNDNPNITYIFQSDLKIMDDNKTGVVKKHAILIYSFLVSSSLNEEDEPDDTEGN